MHNGRVVFLDLDGVLINRASMRLPRIDSPLGSVLQAHPECIAALNRITDVTGARLVLSSSWREEGDSEALSQLLSGWGVKAALIGKTPVIEAQWNGKHLLPGSTRGDEIQAWLDSPAGLASSFVILDDSTDMAHLRHRLVQTDPDAGLTLRDAETAIAMLSLSDL